MGQVEYFLEKNKTSREEQFCDCLRECMKKGSRYLGENVREIYEKGKADITESFRTAFQAGVRQVETMQASCMKGDISYIYISYLLSSALTGENEVKIDFYDRRYFSDLQEADCFWDYGVLFPKYEQEVQEMEYQLRQEVPQLTSYELQKARTYFQVGNFIVLGGFYMLWDILDKENYLLYINRDIDLKVKIYEENEKDKIYMNYKGYNLVQHCINN